MPTPPHHLQLASPPLTGDYLHFPYPQTPLLFSTSTPRDMTSFQDFEELEGLESTHSDNEANQQHPNYVPRSAEIYGAHTTPNYPYNAEASPENQAYWSNGSVPHNAPTRMLPLDHSRVSSAYPVIPWGHSPSSSTSTVSHASPSFAFTRYGPDETAQHNLGNYSSVPSSSPASHRSRSSELVLSPYARSSHLISPPTTPGYIYGMPQPEVSVPNMDGYREQQRLFKEALQLPMVTIAGPFVPQKMYMPHTNSDRRRYVEETELQTPIYFWMQDPVECGIPLIDALHSRVRRLQARDETVFEGRGPSISVRLQWPGYRPWSRQIPTKDFRSPPGPITRAKLAKNVAKCVDRFLAARSLQSLEDDADVRWKVGPRQHEIKLDDLILVSMHHVSMGSWQPHLRLRRPFPS